ncbi:hypothetical protein LINPERPRIM_LOCUS17110 [Linum perenne]
MTAPNTRLGPHLHDHSFWKSVWTLQVPPKIRTFLWRLFKSALPLGPFLSRRIQSHDPICPVCLDAAEIPEHLFLQCKLVQLCLQNEVTPTALRDCPESNISLSWRFLSRLGQDLLVSVAFFWWRVWKARNDVVFSKFLHSPTAIIRTFVSQIQEF